MDELPPLIPDPDPDPNPKRPGHRTKAARLRGKVRSGVTLSPEEIEWLGAYEAQQRATATSTAPFGASASERIIQIEERAASVGSGAAAEAAAMGALAKEEGRRVDNLVRAGIDSMHRACQLYESMARTMLARMQALEDVHLGMLDAVREHYMARTEAEAEVIRSEADNDDKGGVKEMLAAMLMQQVTGVPVARPPTLGGSKK